MRNKCLLMTIFFNLQKPYWSPCPIVQWRILQQLSFSRLLSVFLFFIAMMKMITMTCKLMSKHLSLDKMLVDRDIKASRDSTPLPTSVTTIFTFLVFCWKLFFFWNYHPSTPALFTGERRGVKRLIVSASPALTSDNEYKMENSIWELLGESVKERVSSCCFCCFGLLLTFAVCTLQTQKDGMQTVLSGYDRLVTDSKVSWRTSVATWSLYQTGWQMWQSR